MPQSLEHFASLIVMSHVLILGGSGFFGKSILDAHKRGLLREQNVDQITIVSRHATDLNKLHPELMGQSVRLINADLLSCDALPSADLVIHAAASTDASRYALYPEQERNNILQGISHFCKIAHSCLQKSKILYVSSGAVYGDYPHDIEYITEEYPMLACDRIVSDKRIYTLAKRECEQLIQSLGADGFDVSIARCFAFVGKYLPRDQHFAIGNFIRDGLNKKPIEVKATSSVIRSYMHGDDLSQWLMKIASVSSPATPIFNVGSDEAISIQDLGSKLANFFGVEVSLAAIKSGSINRYVPSIDKAKSQLGLQLKMNLNESIKASINTTKKI